MTEPDAFRILDEAFSLGIRAFDTAEAYGLSAGRLRAWIDRRGHADLLEVITKCTVDSAAKSPRALGENAEKALSRFAGIAWLTVLSHGAVGAHVWPALLETALRRNAMAGQSVYSQDQVSAACGLPGTGIVQAPGNVLDQRAIRARGDSLVRLDSRSVYLQGLLLDDQERAEQRVPGSARISASVQRAAAALGTAAAPLLVASMLRVIEPGDRLVIGVDDASELDVLPQAFEIADETVAQFQQTIAQLSGDPALDLLLDPRRWPTERTV